MTSGIALTADGGHDNDILNVLDSVTIDATLLGGAGNDTLTGGRGSDTSKGGPGNDRYLFRAATALEADIVTELANQGTDTLSFSSLSTDVNLKLGTSAVQSVHTDRTLKLNSGDRFENAVGSLNNVRGRQIHQNSGRGPIYNPSFHRFDLSQDCSPYRAMPPQNPSEG